MAPSRPRARSVQYRRPIVCHRLEREDRSKKIALLVQKNLYAAAISMAYADSNQSAVDIANLYRQYAEHLYYRGEFASAMEQYICTIGILEP